MKKLPITFKVGTRPSNLAVKQARNALDGLEKQLEPHRFKMETCVTTGDQDRTTDLRTSPVDFFTRELDTALREKRIDCALHSAKDLPASMPPDIDWFWLPHCEDPRDVLVLRKHQSLDQLPAHPVFGISSERREQYTERFFPHAVHKPIRGNIEERLAQLDEGLFDVVIMAAAALHRLQLNERITTYIPLEELPVPDGQGYLAITFRQGDRRFQRIRALFTPTLTIAGAGVGHRDLSTMATIRALAHCDLCLYDSLMDQRLLTYLPKRARAIDVGKRCGAHTKEQHEITELLCTYARRAQRVVRLKGGDPGIFGRLAEETEALEALRLPFRVIPGISALQAATTSTGMLLTRRDLSRGFTAITPRAAKGKLASCDHQTRADVPIVYYMSIKAMESIATELLAEGKAPETPVAVIFHAGGEQEEIISTTLAALPEKSRKTCTNKPGLIIVGEVTTFRYNGRYGALEGARVLITASEALQEKTAQWVWDAGGRPIHFPLITLNPIPNLTLSLADYEWVVISSPSSARALLHHMQHHAIDLRALPKLMVCGRETAAVFNEVGIQVDAQPEKEFSATAMIELAKTRFTADTRVLRLRSDKAGERLGQALAAQGARVEDKIIYQNQAIHHEELPEFDALFFASSSAVDQFIAAWGVDALKGKEVVAIGAPTADTLTTYGRSADLVAGEATTSGAIRALAQYRVCAHLDRLNR
jgi:uroporphyrinogen III methyltransferase/synthase